MAESNSTEIPRRVKDLTGQQFGKWTVVGFHSITVKKRQAMWLCRCECGTEKPVLGRNLITGTSRGCLRHGAMSHGRSNTPEYDAWTSLIARCFNTNNPAYQRYGARGIAVCDKWKESFSAFFADMGPRPSPRHSIDRIDNDGHYEPGNCRWATKRQQSRNTSRNQLLTYNGKTMCITDWAIELGLSPNAIRGRLATGWTIDEALTTPRQETCPYRTRKVIEFNGISLCMADWDRKCDLPHGTVHRRLAKGWPVERALTTPSPSRRKSQIEHFRLH